MLLILSPAVRIDARYIQLRGSVYQFYLRVPSDLVQRYGKRFIRKSLETSDKTEAVREADKLARTYFAQFKAYRGDSSLTPAETLNAGLALAREWGDVDVFAEQYAEPKLHAYATLNGLDEGESADLPLDKFLTTVDLVALNQLKIGADAKRLSDAFSLYKTDHARANDAAFIARAQRDWDLLLDLVGDIPLSQLTREHGRAYVTSRLKTVKTTSVSRCLTTLNAVLNHAWREWEIDRPNPFFGLKVPGLGHDAKTRPVPDTVSVREIVEKFRRDTRSTSLLILLHAGTGARVAELSGLAVADVRVDHETPHIDIKPHPWRSLKTKASHRVVPLVGAALEAASVAVDRAKTAKADTVFPEYAKDRGADVASAAVNKRLQEWGITSHSFRHWIKDALREVGCPSDIQEAIQGHAAKSVAATYGKGHSLRLMAGWLAKVDAMLFGRVADGKADGMIQGEPEGP